MAAKANRRLTHTFVKSIKKPGRYSDGPGAHGLTILAKNTMAGGLSKCWCQRIRINGRNRDRGLGSWPVVTLAEAREKALDNKRRVARGEDILKPAPRIPTVDEAFDTVIEQRRPSWKGIETEGHWRLSKRYCSQIGSKLVSEVRQKDVLDILAPIWQEKPKTAREVRSNLATVMQWAITREYRANNPAAPGVVKELGSQPHRNHHPHLASDLLGSTLALIRDADTWWAVRYCLIFIAFTGVRSGEARMATWDEIDWENLTWTIPGSRMKNGLEHKVPLSPQVLDILYYARDQKGGRCEGLIFPPERGSRYVAAARLSDLMKKLGLPASPHGSRASFRNWAGARADIADPVAETVLAHKQPTQNRQAYLNSDFFDERLPVMDKWANHLSSNMGPMIQDEQKPQEKD